MENIDDRIKNAFNDLFTDPPPEEPKKQIWQERRLSGTEIFKEYQQNILKSEGLRSEILKGVNENEDIPKLFLKAAEAIALMTGDNLFYQKIKQKICKEE